MWTTIILVKSTNNLVFLTNFIVEPILSLVLRTQSSLHLNHNSVSLTNTMVVHIMNNQIGCFNQVILRVQTQSDSVNRDSDGSDSVNHESEGSDSMDQNFD